MVEASHPEGLSDAAQELGDRISRLDEVMAGEDRALAELRAAWQGEAARCAFARARRNLAGQELLHDKLGALQSVLASGGWRSASMP